MSDAAPTETSPSIIFARCPTVGPTIRGTSESSAASATVRRVPGRGKGFPGVQMTTAERIALLAAEVDELTEQIDSRGGDCSDAVVRWARVQRLKALHQLRVQERWADKVEDTTALEEFLSQ